jgi:uridylate kinase
MKFIVATNVDGIYDKDPNKFPDSRKLKKVSIHQLIQEYGTRWDSAGKNTVVDGPALEVIKRSKIPTFVLNGTKISELKKVLNNKSFNGTTITLK